MRDVGWHVLGLRRDQRAGSPGLHRLRHRLVPCAERCGGVRQVSASIADISRQVSHAAGIAGRAVEQTRQTDGTVQGLAATASRIGEVVELINSIAGQTNLWH